MVNESYFIQLFLPEIVQFAVVSIFGTIELGAF